MLGPSVHPLDYSFSDWIMAYGFGHKRAIFHEPYYKINGEVVVDDYIRYESLESDVERICNKLGMEYNPSYLMHYKKTKREDVVVTLNARQKISKMFRQELIDLDYTI